MRKLFIKNWNKFQHYSDRSPPWVKLHVDILSSEDWVALDDASRLLAVICMVIGSRNKGEVPDNPDFIKRVAYLNKRPNLTPLIECGFLEITQAVATDCKQVQADDSKCLPEERRAEESRVDSPKDFDLFWKAYPRKVDKGHARSTFAAILRSKRATAQELIDGATVYAVQRVGEPAKFTKHPATWLKGECWKDEPDRTTAPERADEKTKWKLRLEDFQQGGSWLESWGPKPGEQGCQAPPELISNAA